MIANAQFRTIACEPDVHAREIAQRTNPNPRQIHIYPYSLFEISAHLEETAHAIVMHDVLEHIEDERAAVATLAKLLSTAQTVPGARVVLSVPALEGLFGHHDVQLGHYRRYNKRSLRRVLSSHFEIVKMRYFGMFFIPLVIWFSVWRKKDYPKGQAGVGSKLLSAVCRLEEWVPFPIGTSLICELRLRVPNGG